jgi:hypothetical protein
MRCCLHFERSSLLATIIVEQKQQEVEDTEERDPSH